MNGEEVVRIGVGESYTDAGAIANDLFSGERPVNVQSSNPALGYEPGLLAGGMAGNLNSTTPNNGSFGVDPLGPSYSGVKVFSAMGWQLDHCVHGSDL